MTQTAHLEMMQEQNLLALLHKNQKSNFGKAHGFKEIRSVKDYQNQTPIADYDDYLTYINDIKKGGKNVLTCEKVNKLSLTSGSTSATKLIPYTNSLQHEYNNAIGVWLYDIFKSIPNIKKGKSFWIITPVANEIDEKSAVSLGFEKDSSYFGNFEKYAIQLIMATPDKLSQISEIENYYYLLGFYLLTCSNLQLISVWNPTIVPIILSKIINYKDQILSDLKQGHLNLPIANKNDQKLFANIHVAKNTKRLLELQNLLGDDQPKWGKIWKDLKLISCWTDGWAKEYLPQIKSIFSNQMIQGKGLMATEAVVSIPLFESEFPVLAYQSHFYEFIDQDTNLVCLAHQLEKNKKYAVLVTTGGGFYRYKLNDIVEVKGYYNHLPQIEFISKDQHISDLVGEKLNEKHVANVLKTVFEKNTIHSNFYFLAPEIQANKINYVIFTLCDKNALTQGIINNIIDETDSLLSENFHYHHARKLGQLNKPDFFIIKDNCREIYFTEKSKSAQASTVKFTVLERSSNWIKKFSIGEISNPISK